MVAELKWKELLWCLLCGMKFSAADVELDVYFPETGICRKCYGKMRKDDRTCFGKAEFYDQTTLECGQFCPDKKICPEFIQLALPEG